MNLMGLCEDWVGQIRIQAVCDGFLYERLLKPHQFKLQQILILSCLFIGPHHVDYTLTARETAYNMFKPFKVNFTDHMVWVYIHRITSCVKNLPIEVSSNNGDCPNLPLNVRNSGFQIKLLLITRPIQEQP
jgi:hypothetical protein